MCGNKYSWNCYFWNFWLPLPSSMASSLAFIRTFCLEFSNQFYYQTFRLGLLKQVTTCHWQITAHLKSPNVLNHLIDSNSIHRNTDTNDTHISIYAIRQEFGRHFMFIIWQTVSKSDWIVYYMCIGCLKKFFFHTAEYGLTSNYDSA